MDGSIDVVEICALLQCLGFSVKSLDTSDVNASQDAGFKTVVVNCQSSGLHVVLESPGAACSCPPTDHQNSGFWEVSGIAGGRKADKESGSTLLCNLRKQDRDLFSRQLNEMMRNIRERIEDSATRELSNRSTSMLELKTPDKGLHQMKLDTPTRYRSLDTLTARDGHVIPLPGILQKKVDISEENCKIESAEDKNNKMCRRQSTYTLSSTPGSVNKKRNKTSSPIQPPHSTLFQALLLAEKTAEDLRNNLANIRKDFMDDGNNESSMSSLALDVSKISLMKGADTKSQFASSPNLSGLATCNDDFKNNRLRRFESASTSNLAPGKATKDNKISRLRRISPNIFGWKKDNPTVKMERSKMQEKGGKLNCLFKPKIVTPVRVPKPAADISSTMSASKKKYSHIKSTIPRPASRKE